VENQVPKQKANNSSLILSQSLTLLMEQKGLRATKLSNQLDNDISQKTINNIQNGRGATTLEKLDLLANYFGVKSSVLIDEDNSETADNIRLIGMYQKLSDDNKAIIFSLVETLYDSTYIRGDKN